MHEKHLLSSKPDWPIQKNSTMLRNEARAWPGLGLIVFSPVSDIKAKEHEIMLYGAKGVDIYSVCVACRNVCEQDQNGVKQSRVVLRRIRTKS